MLVPTSFRVRVLTMAGVVPERSDFIGDVRRSSSGKSLLEFRRLSPSELPELLLREELTADACCTKREKK